MGEEGTTAELRTSILLVDDRPQNLVALQAILEPLGQNLVLANSGREALRQVLQHEFAVILLDVLMPDLDGFETARLIKEREHSRPIPIIFLTAASTHEQFVFKGYSVGAVDYIFKPVDADILRSKVSVFVDLCRKNEQIRLQAALLRQAQDRERVAAIEELKRVSDKRYRSLADAMPQIVWSAAADGSLTYCNQPWFDGSMRDDGPFELWRKMLHPQDAAAFLEGWRRALATGEEFQTEVRLLSRRGPHPRWHLVRVLPIHEDQVPVPGEAATSPVGQRVAWWIGTCTDIEDRRRAEEALRFLAEASTVLAGSLDYGSTIAQVARLAVDSVADWCVVDLRSPDGSLRRMAVTHSDPTLAELADEIRGLDPETSFAAAQALAEGEHANEETFEGFLLGPQASSDEVRRWRRRLGGGSCASKVLLARGKAIGCVALATTSSGRRMGLAQRGLIGDFARKIVAAIDNAQLYELARREHARLEKANRDKDEFLAIVSHELRTPLNSVLGWAQVLRTCEPDPEILAQGLETIERNAKAQAKLIGDMLEMSRIISGKLPLNVRSLELAEILRSTLDSMLPEIEAKDLALEAELEPCGPMAGDPELLEQVARNLLSNAIKFTPEGGRIRVRTRASASLAGFEIRDTGIGITPEFLPHVFERFSQGDSQASRAHGGLGLGLSIVHHIVALHGGSVDAASDGPGRGAKFSVDLPRSEAGLPQAPARTLPDSVSDLRELAGLRVLLVEDTADARECIERVLAHRGARVTSVATASEALAALERGPQDLLLSDIGLPGESGYDLIRKVRAQGNELPAVALTAYAAASDREQALAAGFQAHVPKPVDANQVVSVLSGLTAPMRS
jgi:signal transduction histidine kinase/DNA-binding response OmpR family regulator